MDKYAIITGISGDIGMKIAETLDKTGYSIIGGYHNNEESIQKLQNTLHNTCYFFKYDFSDPTSADKFIDEVTNLGVNVEILINNAGISKVGMLQDLTVEDWEAMWHVNVTSALFMSKGAIPLFLKGGTGHIINISSVWGERGASCEVGYSATKGALNAFTKALAKELAPSNIQVNALSLGYINTKMNAHLSDTEVQEIVDEIPAGRIGTCEDVADAVVGLINAGKYITGQIIDIDGGWQT